MSHTILAAPAEWTLWDMHSHHNISYKVIEGLSQDYGLNFIAIVNKNRLSKPLRNVEIVQIGLRPSPINRYIWWPIHVYKASMNVLSERKVDLIANLRYFAVGGTPDWINLLAFTDIVEKYPFIMGPAEIQHEVMLEDFLYTYAGVLKSTSVLKGMVGYCLQKLLLGRTKLVDELAYHILGKCDRLIVGYEKAKDFYSRFVDRRKIEVIPLCIDTRAFAWSAPPDNYEILCTGGGYRRKGVDYLVMAMKEVVEEYPSAKLHITRIGPHTLRLLKLVKDLKLGKNVIFHRYLPKEALIGLFRKCRLFCNPSLSEGFAYVNIEAMALGRPVISTEAANSNTIYNGRNGIIVRERDSHELAEAILRLFGDYELTYRMGWNARVYVERKHERKIVLRRYYELFMKYL